MEWVDEFIFPSDESSVAHFKSQHDFLWKGVEWFTSCIIIPENDALHLYFVCETDSTLSCDWTCPVKFKFSIVDKNGISIIEGIETFHVFPKPKTENNIWWCQSINTFCYSDIKNKVNIFPIVSIKVDFAECQSNGERIPFLHEIARMFTDKTTSDSIIKVDDGGHFPAHKCILSARSEVFKTMLSCGMQESVSGEVLIPDVDSATMEAFLRYLYTNVLSVTALDMLGPQLLALAHQYQIQDLVTIIANHMKRTLNNSSVFNCLQLALKYDLSLLNEACAKHIREHKKEIFSDFSVINSLDASL